MNHVLCQALQCLLQQLWTGKGEHVLDQLQKSCSQKRLHKRLANCQKQRGRLLATATPSLWGCGISTHQGHTPILLPSGGELLEAKSLGVGSLHFEGESWRHRGGVFLIVCCLSKYLRCEMNPERESKTKECFDAKLDLCTHCAL